MNLVDDQLLQKKQKAADKTKTKKELKFDSGSERDSIRHNEDSLADLHENNNISEYGSDKSNISVNMTYKPTIIDKQADIINKKFKEDYELAENASDFKTASKLNEAIMALDRAAGMSLDLRGNQNMSLIQHHAVIKQMSMAPRRTVDCSFLSDFQTQLKQEDRKET